MIDDQPAPATRPNGARYDVVGFDADDTLWRSEDHFVDAERRFVELITPYAPDGIDVRAVLSETEASDIPISGYGVKAFALSMVRAAVTATGGRVPAAVIGDLVEHAREMLMHPVELLPGVPETLEAVARTHRVVLITKGDLVHQLRKVNTSGIAHHFERIEVVLDKDPPTYARVLDEWGVPPNRFVMVGNSIRSDILPVLELGGGGIHIAYHTTWVHELVDGHHGGFVELPSIADVPAWLAG